MPNKESGSQDKKLPQDAIPRPKFPRNSSTLEFLPKSSSNKRRPCFGKNSDQKVQFSRIWPQLVLCRRTALVHDVQSLSKFSRPSHECIGQKKNSKYKLTSRVRMKRFMPGSWRKHVSYCPEIFWPQLKCSAFALNSLWLKTCSVA